MEFIILLLEILIIPAGVVWFIWYRKRQNKLGREEKNKKLELINRDALSECLFLFAMFLWGSFLFALKSDFHTNIPWHTIVLLTAITAICIAYRYQLRFTLLGSLIGLLVWWIAQASDWSRLGNMSDQVSSTFLPETQVRPAAAVAGFILLSLTTYLLGRVHERNPRYNRFAMLFTLVGIVSVTGLLFLFSQKDGLDTFESMTQGRAITSSWQLSIFVLGFVFSLAGAMWYVAKNKFINFYELYVLGFLALLFLSFLFLPHKILFSNSYYGYSDTLTGDGFLYALFFNVLLFLFLVGIIFSGYQRKEVWRINMGAIFLFLFIFLKYFDWFFTYLDKSVFFISAGILLFVVGYGMERGRRMMISVVTEPEKEKGEKK